MLTYLLHPYPFVNGWRNSILLAPGPAWEDDRMDQVGPDTLVVTWGEAPPFEERVNRLPGGLCRLDPGRPYIVRMNNPNCGVQRPEGREPLTWVGSRPARLTIWSPWAGRAALTFAGHAGPSRPGDARRRLVVRQSTGADREFDLSLSGEARVVIPLDLPAGVSTLEVHCPDPPIVEMRWPGGEPYQLLVALQAPKITLLTPRPDAKRGSVARRPWRLAAH
jgi:hypothetical protein